MKLSYRGIKYEYVPPTTEVTEGEVMGKYRGQVWHNHVAAKAPASHPTYHLRYRGVSYDH